MPPSKKMLLQIEQNKKALIVAMEKNMGVVTAACKACRVERATFYNYYNNDKDFAKSIDDVGEQMLDFAESKLKSLIRDGDKTAILFYLKTKGKHRGYIEQNVNLNLNQNHDVNKNDNLKKYTTEELEALRDGRLAIESDTTKD